MGGPHTPLLPTLRAGIRLTARPSSRPRWA